MKRKNDIDELTLKRLQKETDFGVIVLGNGVIDYQKIKCTNCKEIFRDFNKHYSVILERIVPSCPKCNVHVFSHEFLPLDESNNVITSQ